MFNFDNKLEIIFKAVAQNADELGVSAFFVGGMVRDMLLEIEIKDIDILIEGSAIDFARNFEKKFKTGSLDINIKSIHEAFNTVKSVINGTEIDFASTREEEYPLSGCLPAVKNTGCPVEKDLRRRDFTVNAIAAKLCLKDGGKSLCYKLFDPFSGARDIELKTLRILHDKSYIDDPTRILRGLDFKLRFGFEFSDSDRALIDKYLNAPDREGLSLERVKLTLKKLFSSPKRAKTAYTEILKNRFYKIWQDTPSFKEEWAQRLEESASFFNLETKDVYMAAIFESEKFLTLPSLLPQNPDLAPYEIYDYFKSFKPLDLALYYAIFNDKNTCFYYKNLKGIKPYLSGDDLIKAGFKQGKTLGQALFILTKEKINKPALFSSKEDELNFILKNCPP